MDADGEKRLAARAAAELVEAGMTVGLGTGSTVAHLLDELAARSVDATYVATSPRTDAAARSLGLRVVEFTDVAQLDLAIDGADQVAPDGWLVKGASGAMTRERVVAAAAAQFVVIVDSTKPVRVLHPPVPVEVLAFGLASTLRELGTVTVRPDGLSPDGGVLCDLHCDVDDPGALASRLSLTPGIIGHGLFAPSMVAMVLVGDGDAVRTAHLGGTT